MIVNIYNRNKHSFFCQQLLSVGVSMLLKFKNKSISLLAPQHWLNKHSSLLLKCFYFSRRPNSTQEFEEKFKFCFIPNIKVLETNLCVPLKNYGKFFRQFVLLLRLTI